MQLVSEAYERSRNTYGYRRIGIWIRSAVEYVLVRRREFLFEPDIADVAIDIDLVESRYDVRRTDLGLKFGWIDSTIGEGVADGVGIILSHQATLQISILALRILTVCPSSSVL